jgi:hypothetical protein
LTSLRLRNLERGIRGRELMGVFFYHLYRKLVREEDRLFNKGRAAAGRYGRSKAKFEDNVPA